MPFHSHISAVCSSHFHYIQYFWHIHQHLLLDSANYLLMLWLDYCNSLFPWKCRQGPHQTSACPEVTGLCCDKVTTIYYYLLLFTTIYYYLLLFTTIYYYLLYSCVPFPVEQTPAICPFGFISSNVQETYENSFIGLSSINTSMPNDLLMSLIALS